MESGDARRRIDADAQDFLRVLGRDFLDLHATFRGGDDGDATADPIDQERQIKFPGDIASRLDIDPPHRAPVRSGLLGDQRVADHRLGGCLHLGRRACEAHPALAVWVVGETAGTAAARVDLRLYHVYRPGKLGGHRLGLFRRPSDMSVKHRDTVALQEFLALVFVDVHVWLPRARSR